MGLLNKIEIQINELKQTFDKITPERKKLLLKFSRYIQDKISMDKEINLVFICTHNSRRSFMSQIWCQAAAEYYSIPNVKCYSGGTEATAFNPRAVSSVQNTGFEVEKQDESDNPLYLVSYSDSEDPLKCFSKVYNHPFNPQTEFAAIMTCSHADENCPVIFGAEARFPINYEDPKIFDDTQLEELKYQERFKEIGRELLYSFQNVLDL